MLVVLVPTGVLEGVVMVEVGVVKDAEEGSMLVVLVPPGVLEGGVEVEVGVAVADDDSPPDGVATLVLVAEASEAEEDAGTDVVDTGDDADDV